MPKCKSNCSPLPFSSLTLAPAQFFYRIHFAIFRIFMGFFKVFFQNMTALKLQKKAVTSSYAFVLEDGRLYLFVDKTLVHIAVYVDTRQGYNTNDLYRL